MSEASRPDDLFPLVYDELRRLAAARMTAEPVGHSLDATALVHEAYLRLADQSRFENRGHFLRAAATAMWHVLVDHAWSRTADKRGGGRVQVTPDGTARWADSADHLVALDGALRRFAAEEPRKAELDILRFFGGMTTTEVGQALGVSVATAESPAEELFFAALSKTPAERTACLDAACADNPALRARVEKLLAA